MSCAGLGARGRSYSLSLPLDLAEIVPAAGYGWQRRRAKGQRGTQNGITSSSSHGTGEQDPAAPALRLSLRLPVVGDPLDLFQEGVERRAGGAPLLRGGRLPLPFGGGVPLLCGGRATLPRVGAPLIYRLLGTFF